MTWLFALTFIPLAVVVSGLISEAVATRLIGEDRAKYAAYALVLGFFAAKIQPGAGELVSDLPMSIGAVLGLAVLWWKLFRREGANG